MSNIQMPSHQKPPSKTMALENYYRCEALSVIAMAKMVAKESSTRNVFRIMETICNISYFKSLRFLKSTRICPHLWRIFAIVGC